MNHGDARIIGQTSKVAMCSMLDTAKIPMHDAIGFCPLIRLSCHKTFADRIERCDKMKRRNRKRRILKWMAVGLCALLVAGWIVNAYRNVAWGSSRWTLGVGGGRLIFGRLSFDDSSNLPLGWNAWRSDGQFEWWPEFQFDGRFNFVNIPIWMLLLATALATLWLWRHNHSAKLGCVNCGYNLTGNVSGVCPECGTNTDAHLKDRSADR